MKQLIAKQWTTGRVQRLRKAPLPSASEQFSKKLLQTEYSGLNSQKHEDQSLGAKIAEEKAIGRGYPISIPKSNSPPVYSQDWTTRVGQDRARPQ